MINDFEKAENKGRAKFEKLCEQNWDICNLQFTTNTYDNVDAYFYYKGKKFAVEIKNRESYYDSWNVEVLKYEKMKEALENGEIEGGYFAVFYKDKAYLYDFNTIEKCYTDFGVGNMWAKKTTMGNSDYTTKKVITLPVSRAKIYNI